jgi:hypothetical protein
MLRVSHELLPQNPPAQLVRQRPQSLTLRAFGDSERSLLMHMSLLSDV